MHSVKHAGAKHGVREVRSGNKHLSGKSRSKKRFPGRVFEDRMEKIEAEVRKEMKAERRAERGGKPKVARAPTEPEETGPSLLTLARPLGKMHHAALGYIDDDEAGD